MSPRQPMAGLPGADRVPINTTIGSATKSRLQREAMRRGVSIGSLIDDLVAAEVQRAADLGEDGWTR